MAIQQAFTQLHSLTLFLKVVLVFPDLALAISFLIPDFGTFPQEKTVFLSSKEVLELKCSCLSGSVSSATLYKSKGPFDYLFCNFCTALKCQRQVNKARSVFLSHLKLVFSDTNGMIELASNDQFCFQTAVYSNNNNNNNNNKRSYI